MTVKEICDIINTDNSIIVFGKRVKSDMIKNELDNTLKHYCDAIIIYDYSKDLLFLYYDKIFPECENKWYSFREIEEIYTSGGFNITDSAVIEKKISPDAFRSFFESEKESKKFEVKIRHKSGELYWYEVIMQKIGGERISVSYKNTYGEILNSSLQKAMENVFENILYIDTESAGYILHCVTPENMDKFTDRYYNEMITEYIKKHAVKEEIKVLTEQMQLENVIKMLITRESFSIYATMRSGDGNIAYKKLTFAYIDRNREIITLVKTDVSDIVKEYNSQLKFYKNASYNDALTGAYNRKYYEENLRNKRVSYGIAMIDIDDFKLCNDIYGHSAGDMALTKLVKILNDCIGENDFLVKYGGDEFLLFMRDITDAHKLESTLNGIKSSISKIYMENFPDIRLSVSIGGVIADNETVEDAVFRADGLMYQAKNRKNTVITELNADDENIPAEKAVKQQILIVDDSELNRDILSEMLGKDFKILTADGGEECLEKIQQYGTGISLILLDIVMPGMDGFDVLNFLNKTGIIDDIPVILISSENSDEMVRRAYGMGVSDYIARPFDTKVVQRRVLNIIKMHMKQRKLVSLVSGQIRDREKNVRIMLEILSQIVEFRNGESGLHVWHINRITELLLDSLIKKTGKYNISWKERNLIKIASSLHDIGKICVDEKILNKPGKLTKEEFEIIKTHTTLGAEMLTSLPEYKSEKIVRIAAEVCRWHHERYDGKGYPDGLSGDDIPISAQVVSVADVYDALVSKRAYKEPFTHEEAVRKILSGECGAFNPLLLECLKDIQYELSTEIV